MEKHKQGPILYLFIRHPLFIWAKETLERHGEQQLLMSY